MQISENHIMSSFCACVLQQSAATLAGNRGLSEPASQRAAVLSPRMNLVSGSSPSLKKLGAQEPFSPAWPATKGTV